MTVKDYSGFHRAIIKSYDSAKREAKIVIPTITGDNVEIEATFMYPVSHDDRDTELKIVANNHVYVFFEGGDVYSPVICGYSSHGTGAVQGTRRIRQRNIEILADQNIKIHGQSVEVKGNTTFLNNVVINGSLKVEGSSDLEGTTTIENKAWSSHRHSNGNNGSNTGGVV